jgi:mannosyltransferase
LALGVCAVVLLAAGLRVYALDHQSLWADEIFSLTTTDPALPFRQFWDRVIADTHPPVYYLLLRLSSTAFGQSEIAARAPSAFFGVLTICAAALLPGSSLSRSSRVAFPLLLAVSPGAVWYAREARSYALLLLLSTIIAVAYIRFLRCSPQEDRKARRAILMLAVAAVLASFTHYFRLPSGCRGLLHLRPGQRWAAPSDGFRRRYGRPHIFCSVGLTPRRSY